MQKKGYITTEEQHKSGEAGGEHSPESLCWSWKEILRDGKEKQSPTAEGRGRQDIRRENDVTHKGKR